MQSTIRARIAADAEDLADLLPHVAVKLPGENTVLRLPPADVIREKDEEDTYFAAQDRIAAQARLRQEQFPSDRETAYGRGNRYHAETVLDFPCRIGLVFVDCATLPLKLEGEAQDGPLIGRWTATADLRSIQVVDVGGVQGLFAIFDAE